MKITDLEDLNRLMECEIIRVEKRGEEVHLLLVADSEEDEIHHEDEDEEECDDDCCSGLNGHLFEIIFSKVENYSVQGKECDNFKTRKVETEPHFLYLDLEGHNYVEEDEDMVVSFRYDSFKVLDRKIIESPDA